MKFLCVSDQIDPLIYSSSVKERYGDVDAVFCAGDLSMEYVDFIVDSLSKPTYFIFGNHDLSEYKYYKKTAFGDIPEVNYDKGSHFHGADYASNRTIKNKFLYFTAPNGKRTPLLIAGITGTLRYNKGQAQFTEAQMKRQLIAMIPSLLWNKIR
ncbi:metallophosphoesterase, partial [Treponema sp.]